MCILLLGGWEMEGEMWQAEVVMRSVSWLESVEVESGAGDLYVGRRWNFMKGPRGLAAPSRSSSVMLSMVCGVSR